MNSSLLKEMVAAVKSEWIKRGKPLPGEDGESARSRWVFAEEALLNELCLALLVVLRHEVERELVRIMARNGEGGKEITGQQYADKVRRAQRTMRDGKNGWGHLEDNLKLPSCEGWKAMKGLRLLTNSYKHNPWKRPSRELLKFLDLEPLGKYAWLPESGTVRAGVGALVNLEPEADYCEIAEQFVRVANEFILEIQRQVKLSPVRSEPIPLRPAL